MGARPIGYAVVLGVLLCVGVFVALLAGLFRGDEDPVELLPGNVWAAYRRGYGYPKLQIVYPLDETLFPPEIVAPTFRWRDDQAEADTWAITFEFEGGQPRLSFLTSSREWTAPHEQWETIKRRSLGRKATVTVLGVTRSGSGRILSEGRITVGTSKDPVGAPLFYREVNLPFKDAVRDPSKIRWRFGTIDRQTAPPIVLQKLPVCGNCHSFSADASVFGMDVDYANDKGSYAIAPVTREVVLDKSRIITWADYKREDKEPTYGLLSQVSPDGKFVVSTVKDRSVFVPKPDLYFSQLFFPVKGILAVYNRQARTFSALPGADDKQFVQSNPSWSPDGKTIAFIRSKAYELAIEDANKVLLSPEECSEFLEGERTFLFDIYVVPFNDGKGGKAEPLAGASHNGMSNYFPKYSPDGKWIVFCKAKTFSLLQPDSQLYIVPAGGGEARRLRCNTPRMNSWHSWSPNGRWLVFSSKANGPYTQLFLTHIDPQGRSSPPVLLSNFTAADRAANIPEFVNARPGAIARIREQFLDARSFCRAGDAFFQAGDVGNATRSYRKALEIDPNSVRAHNHLGIVLCQRGQLAQGIRHFKQALRVEPDNSMSLVNLATAFMQQGNYPLAAGRFRRLLVLNPDDSTSLTMLALILATARNPQLRNGPEAVKLATKACRLSRSAASLDILSTAYAEAGRFDEAIRTATQALQLARKAKREGLARGISRRIRLYQQRKPFRAPH